MATLSETQKAALYAALAQEGDVEVVGALRADPLLPAKDRQIVNSIVVTRVEREHADELRELDAALDDAEGVFNAGQGANHLVERLAVEAPREPLATPDLTYGAHP